jgi:hypothetical protein
LELPKLNFLVSAAPVAAFPPNENLAAAEAAGAAPNLNFAGDAAGPSVEAAAAGPVASSRDFAVPCASDTAPKENFPAVPGALEAGGAAAPLAGELGMLVPPAAITRAFALPSARFGAAGVLLGVAAADGGPDAAAATPGTVTPAVVPNLRGAMGDGTEQCPHRKCRSRARPAWCAVLHVIIEWAVTHSQAQLPHLGELVRMGPTLLCRCLVGPRLSHLIALQL